MKFQVKTWIANGNEIILSIRDGETLKVIPLDLDDIGLVYLYGRQIQCAPWSSIKKVAES